jgi:hypothetical protein
MAFVFDPRAVFQRRVMAQLEMINRTAAGEVIYSDLPRPGDSAARRLNATSLTVAGDGDTARGHRAHLERHAEDLFFRKLEDWASEFELRYVLLDDDDSEVTVRFEGLREVILGERFPDWQLAGAQTAAPEPGALLLKMEWAGSPSLTAPAREGPASGPA